MSERTIWTCDGCETEQVVRPDTHKNDWRRITVELSGFNGYPIGEHGNREQTFELCPHCQRTLHEYANPRTWAREAKKADSS